MHILGFETANWRQAREQALATADQRPLASTGRKVKHIHEDFYRESASHSMMIRLNQVLFIPMCINPAMPAVVH